MDKSTKVSKPKVSKTASPKTNVKIAKVKVTKVVKKSSPKPQPKEERRYTTDTFWDCVRTTKHDQPLKHVQACDVCGNFKDWSLLNDGSYITVICNPCLKDETVTKKQLAVIEN